MHSQEASPRAAAETHELCSSERQRHSRGASCGEGCRACSRRVLPSPSGGDTVPSRLTAVIKLKPQKESARRHRPRCLQKLSRPAGALGPRASDMQDIRSQSQSSGHLHTRSTGTRLQLTGRSPAPLTQGKHCILTLQRHLAGLQAEATGFPQQLCECGGQTQAPWTVT